jgi:hypothetical protein
MPLNDALHRRQPDTGPWKIGHRVQPLEYAKQVARITWIESYAIVPDKECLPLRIRAGPEFDPRNLAHGSELAGIVQQVLDHDFQQPDVSIHPQARFNGRDGARHGRTLAHSAHHTLGQGRQVDRFAVQLDAGYPAQLQQIINQRGHADCARLDPFEIAAAVPIQFVEVLRMQQPGKP